MRTAIKFLTALTAVILSACGAEPVFDNEYPPNFIFHVDYHRGSIIEDALSIGGTFVFISVPTDGNPRYVITPNNADREEVFLPVSEVERRQLEGQRKSAFGSMGINRRLFVGTSHFDGLKAYDGHCPNCHADTGTRNCPLNWADNRQHITCGRCNRTYDPNAAGVVLNAQKKSDLPLKQYHINYDGKVLSVRN